MKTITIKPSEWEETGGIERPHARLLATIHINGCPMHLEAYEIAEPDGEEQRFVSPCEGVEHALYDIVEGAAQTVLIRGRSYVLTATPFQA